MTLDYPTSFFCSNSRLFFVDIDANSNKFRLEFCKHLDLERKNREKDNGPDTFNDIF